MCAPTAATTMAGRFAPSARSNAEPGTLNPEPSSGVIWIAVDAMGGDAAPGAVIDGAVAALGDDGDLGVVLVGPVDRLDAELRRHPAVDRDRVRLAEAPDVVAMVESPSAALRRKPGASIRVAAE